MKSSKFILLSFKKNILPFLFVCFTVCLVIFSKQNLQATKNGLLLWANSVVPALLPFFIATELLSHTNIVNKLGKLLNPLMKPLFNVPGIGAFALVMGIISGYPTGAKIVTSFRNDGLCTKTQGERLLSFTNNSGPLFIIGTVGITMFGNSQIGIFLFLIHLISSLLVGFIFRFWKYNDNEKPSLNTRNTANSANVTFSNLGEVLATSIMNSVHTIIMICGFVIIFSVIISILTNCKFFEILTLAFTPFFKKMGISSSFITAISSGFLELTNGLNIVSTIPQKAISINLIITSFLLGFGGISVLLQVLSITSKSDISIKPYFYGKLLQGIISAILSYIFMHIFPIFNFDITPIFSQNAQSLSTFSPNFAIGSILVCILAISSFWFYFSHKQNSSTYIHIKE